MKTPQSELKMSTVSLADTSRKTTTPLTYGSNSNRMISIRLTVCFSSARRHKNTRKTSQVRVLYRFGFVKNATAVVSWVDHRGNKKTGRLRNKSSKFYKISSVLNEIMLKILGFV